MNPILSNAILENLLDGVLIVDEEGMIIYANAAAKALFSNGRFELVGEIFGYPITMEVQEIEILSNGHFLTVQMLPTSIWWDNKSACLLSIRDITQLKNITNQLEEQKVNLENVNLELEQYASLASHDLKEPVRKIMMFSDRLLNQTNLTDVSEVKCQLNKIFQSANRMQLLISGIAEYSKYRMDGITDRSIVDLHQVLQDVLIDLELMVAEKNAKILFEHLPAINAIKIQMHQLFLNIISNAIKYSKENVDPVILISVEDHDNYVEITITDNGIGFDEISKRKVFEPFQRLRNTSSEGSGIGLAICKKIVIAHGGVISVESKPGEGCRFRFTLKK